MHYMLCERINVLYRNVHKSVANCGEIFVKLPKTKFIPVSSSDYKLENLAGCHCVLCRKFWRLLCRDKWAWRGDAFSATNIAANVQWLKCTKGFKNWFGLYSRKFQFFLSQPITKLKITTYLLSETTNETIAFKIQELNQLLGSRFCCFSKNIWS